ncbi:unnamed protein product [Gongylonema pulchrum]|uniref:ETS domain-containing protein n=1 Tax=Gongylonema pulchrum TaxID=637853 RepID=A0A183ERH8_9BILA|nr:unnamed protein product [Gongylonema pulchrum]
MMWTLNSQNKLYFTRRIDKYSFLDRPEEFLVTQKNIDTLVHGPPTPTTKRAVVRQLSSNLQRQQQQQHSKTLQHPGIYELPQESLFPNNIMMH